MVNEIGRMISVADDRTPNLRVCLPEPRQSVDEVACWRSNEGGPGRISVVSADVVISVRIVCRSDSGVVDTSVRHVASLPTRARPRPTRTRYLPSDYRPEMLVN